jgi:RNA polymerase sigma factor (sigma-70 family)
MTIERFAGRSCPAMAVMRQTSTNGLETRGRSYMQPRPRMGPAPEGKSCAIHLSYITVHKEPPSPMPPTPQDVVTWVGLHIIPHERAVRSWLRRSRLAPHDIDDLVQEAYCRLSSLTDTRRIARPDRYFFQVVKNLLGEQLRRARVVQFETMAEMDALSFDAEELRPDQAVASARELARVRELIDALPERCRRIITLRKLEGLSQREVATKLGISESIVENEGVKGMRLLMQALKKDEDGMNCRLLSYERSAQRK